MTGIEFLEGCHTEESHGPLDLISENLDRPVDPARPAISPYR
jgi:hypothetical protein